MNGNHQIDFVEVTTAGDVFDTADSRDFEALLSDAEAAIDEVFSQGEVIAFAYSSGKDSSVVASIALNTARNRIERGLTSPTIIACHSDTLIENPEVRQLADREMAKMADYANAHGIDLRVDVATPNLTNHYLVQILAGRATASLPENGSQCSQMLKVSPLTRQKKRLRRQYGGHRIVTLLGTRLEESDTRRRNMEARRESALSPVENAQGELILSPIMDWSIDHVFEYLGSAKAGLIAAYSNFEDLLELYRGFNGGACELAVYASGKPPRTGCSARSGCSICLRSSTPRADERGGLSETKDESLNNMIKEPRYFYMRGLARLRDYIAAKHYDPNRRNWIARRCNDDGTINISPVAYSPEHCSDLIKMIMTLDVEEQEAADELGIAPRFQLLRPEDVVAIDFISNRYGYTESFNALFWYREIHHRGKRFPVPANPKAYPKIEFPPQIAARFADSDYDALFNGLRDLDAATAGAEQLVTKGPGGRYYSGGGGGDEFRVDVEGAELFIGFEMDRVLDNRHQNFTCPTAAAHYFLRLGTVSLHRGGHSENERMLRVANQIQRHGLRGILNSPDALLERLGRSGSDEAAQTSNDGQWDLFAVNE